MVAAYEQAIATPGPFLIDFQVKEEVNVYPMVPPGAAVDQLIRRPKPSVVQGYSAACSRVGSEQVNGLSGERVTFTATLRLSDSSMGKNIMTHTLIAWMRDKPGVLNRVAGMLRRRNFNIDSLQVGHSETPGISRMTFVVDGNEHMVDQVIKQLRKIVDVTRVEDIIGASRSWRVRWRWCVWRPAPETVRRSCSWWTSTAARSSTSRWIAWSCRSSAPKIGWIR